jgi:pentatricopeptide repeat protein
MNASHICSGCRRRLSQSRGAKAFQWHPRATFISLANSNNTRITTDETAKEDLLKLGDESRRGKVSQAGIYLETRRRTRRPTSNHNPGDLLEALFEQSLKQPAPAANPPPQIITSLEPYKNAETLKEMLDGDDFSVAECWQFFVEHFGPDAWKTGSIDKKSSPSYLENRARTLIRQVIHAKKNDPFSQTLPLVTEVSTICFQLEMLHGLEWVQLMLNLLASISRSGKSPVAYSKSDVALISDLLGSWNVVCRHLGSFQDRSTADASALHWGHIPTFCTNTIIRAHRNRGTQGSFGLLTPKFSAHQLNDLPIVALGTFTILTKESNIGKEMLDNNSPLISSLGKVISVGGFKWDQLNQLASGSPDPAAASAIESIKEDWLWIKDRAAKFVESPTGPAVSSPPVTLNLISMHNRVQDALGRRDGSQVDRLWLDVAELPVYNGWQSDPETETGKNVNNSKRGTLSAGLCNYFILAYMALRQPNRAIDVWNHMVGKGLPPNLATWNHMLMGCKQSRDGKALEEVWTKMHILQVQPDIHCWTTRISGLIECGKIEPAIFALNEMGKAWLTATKKKYGDMKFDGLQQFGDIEGAVKPTIELINAALSGLLRKQKSDVAHKILGWASNFGISPNVITYNTLLRPLIRDGHSKQAMALLQNMQKSGIQADVATFTTILDETLRHSDQYTLEEQNEIVANVFREMEVSGVQANLHTYGKIIYQLLQIPDRETMKSVNIVLQRMAKQGLQPSTYIYTILVEHYFDQQPPDLDAVRSLIERSSLQVGSTDNIFWDRVIEGYARVGDTISAVRILGRVNSGNSKASWLTLTTLLTALTENDEWGVARSLVRNAKIDSGGPPPEYEHGKEGQHRFWRLVKELNLLDI